MSILLFVKISLTDFSLARSDTRRTAVRKVSRSSLIRSFASDGITWVIPFDQLGNEQGSIQLKCNLVFADAEFHFTFLRQQTLNFKTAFVETFSTEEVQKILASVDTSHVVGHRDRAFLATLAYTFARIGAVVNLKVEDYFQAGKRSLIRFKEKGGKEKEIPVHHKLEEILDEYLKVSKLRENPVAPLFPTMLGKSRELGSRQMTRFDGANLLKRRLRDAGIVGDYSPHSFRATGITNYLENGGTLEVAQRIAGHADSRTTKLYDRRGQKVLLEDMERIRY